MNYGLPLTGPGALVIAGATIHYPWVVAIGASLVIGGALLLRLTRPVRARR